MLLVFGIIFVVVVIGLAYAAYDLFFKKNPNAVSSLDTKYVDPVLAEKQRVEQEVADKALEEKAKIEGIVVKL